ncbi:recombinase family protein, partial [Eggerthella lenta]
GLQTEMSDALALHAEHDRLASGGLIRRNVPFGYVFDEDAPCGARVDGEVAAFVPRIFELAAQGRWWRSKLEGQVRELGCPGPRQRANELYGHNRHAIEGWDYAAIRSMVTNPFYTGDFAPERLASIRMRKSGIPIGSFPVIEGHHPALVGRELFEEANEGLARNRYACPTKAEGRRPCRG